MRVHRRGLHSLRGPHWEALHVVGARPLFGLPRARPAHPEEVRAVLLDRGGLRGPLALRRLSEGLAFLQEGPALASSSGARYVPGMAKSKDHPSAASSSGLVVRYLESPNAILTEAPVLEVGTEGPNGRLDLVVQRPGNRGKLTLYGVAPLDPKASPPTYPTWHEPKPERA